MSKTVCATCHRISHIIPLLRNNGCSLTNIVPLLRNNGCSLTNYHGQPHCNLTFYKALSSVSVPGKNKNHFPNTDYYQQISPSKRLDPTHQFMCPVTENHNHHSNRSVDIKALPVLLRKDHKLLANGISGHVFWRNFHVTSKHCEQNTEKSFIVTQDNIFSKENKERFQKKLTSNDALRNIPIKKNYRTAAVLIPMCIIDDKPSILFMERSYQVPAHRGEICFPGGMSDDTDPDIVYTALRETLEEIGLSTENIDVWGSMQQVASRQDGSNLVTPVVAFCGELKLNDLVLNKREVESVFTRSISSLCDPENIGSTQFRTRNGYTLPVYLGKPHRIWGLTAIFLHFALTAILPGMYKFKVKHRH